MFIFHKCSIFDSNEWLWSGPQHNFCLDSNNFVNISEWADQTEFICEKPEISCNIYFFWRRALLKMCWTPSLWSYFGLQQKDRKPLLKEHVIFASAKTSKYSSLMIQLFSYFTILITTSAHCWLKWTFKSSDESF